MIDYVIDICFHGRVKLLIIMFFLNLIGAI